MKANEIQDLFNSFENIAIEYDSVECWSARELAPVMGYAQWRNFSSIIEKAKESAINAGENTSDHFSMSSLQNSTSFIKNYWDSSI